MAPPPPLLLLLLLTLAGSSWAQDLLPDGPVDAVLGRNVTLKTLLVKPVYAFIVWNFYDGTEQVNIATQTATGLHANDVYKDRVSVDPVTGSLTLTAVRADDSGDYSITVITVDGTTRTAEIKLRVLEEYLNISLLAKISYGVFIAKSCIYCAFVAFLRSKLLRSARKLSP